MVRRRDVKMLRVTSKSNETNLIDSPDQPSGAISCGAGFIDASSAGCV